MIREVVAIAYRSLRMVILRVSRRKVNVVASADSIQPRTVLGIIFSVLHFWHAKRGTLATRRSAPAVSVIEIHDLCDEPAPLRWRIGRLLLSCTGRSWHIASVPMSLLRSLSGVKRTSAKAPETSI